MSDDIGTVPEIDRTALAGWMQSHLAGAEAVEIEGFSPPRMGAVIESSLGLQRKPHDVGHVAGDENLGIGAKRRVRAERQQAPGQRIAMAGLHLDCRRCGNRGAGIDG